jgi:drug/metabolite transporter (DMT)-like permease
MVVVSSCTSQLISQDLRFIIPVNPRAAASRRLPSLPSDAMNRTRADALLLLVALIWGSAFVAQKDANDHIGPILFVGLRFSAAALFLLPLALWEARRATQPLSRADLRGAFWISLCLCAGCWFQQIGIQTTSATNAGFLTAVYMVIVPFVAWIFSGRAPRPIVLVASAVALLGAWLMTGGADMRQASRGDLIILAGDLVWALHITLVGHCVGMTARPMLLSFLQCAVTGVLSLPYALATEPVTAGGLQGALPALLYAGLLSSGVAFTLQIVAQRYTPAPEAALIMSMESVFAAIAGAWLLSESLSGPAWLGAGLILLGVLLVESGPALAGTLASAWTRATAAAGRDRS